MKKFIFLVFLLFLIPLANAGSFGYDSQNDLGTFKQNGNLDFRQVCNNATYITITSISYPDSSIAVSNISMTNTGYGEFNYTFNLTSQLGRYDIRGVSDGCEGTFVTYFEVTPTGTEGISVALVIILFLGSILFGFFSWFFSRDMFLHILFMFTSLLVLLYAINQLHITMLFFTSVVVVLLAFVYYIINYIRDVLSSIKQRSGFEF